MNDPIDKAVENARAVYQKVAAAYDENTSKFQQEIVYPKIVSAITSLVGSIAGKKILDIGCGSGRLMKILSDRQAIPTGVDVAPAFWKNNLFPELCFIEASMHKLPFDAHTFDGAVSNFALNYLPPDGQRMSLQEQFRVLRPGGAIVFSYMHPSLMRSDNYFAPIREREVRLLGEAFRLYLLDWPEILNLVIRAGFSLQEMIDAEIPENLDKVVSSVKDPAVAQFIQSSACVPYGIFVAARKPN